MIAIRTRSTREIYDVLRFAVALLLMTAACRAVSVPSTSVTAVTAREVAYLHAFARLYGIIRWFHPSDAAAAVDWDQLAMEGVHRVSRATDRQTLRAALDETFSSISPTVHIIDRDDAFPIEPALHPVPANDLQVVAWQHSGYGDSIAATTYASKRRHRDRLVAIPGSLFAALSRSLDADSYRGVRIRLRGKLRAANHGSARLWLRVDRGEERGFFDNMSGRPVVNDTWENAEIVATVDSDATKIVFGMLMLGVGTTWYDEIELSAQAPDGSWSLVNLPNGGFEGSAVLDSWQTGIGKRSQGASNEGWNLTIDHDRPASGYSSLRIERATKVVTEELFDDAPSPGETYDVELGSGLRARVPIALYSRDGHTIGDNLEAMRVKQAAPILRTRGFDVQTGVADVIVVWNVLEHFWPYWDMISVDWNSELDVALNDALDDRNIDDHVSTLERLSVAAPDGHGRVSCSGTTEIAFPPFAVDLVEGFVVVTSSSDPAIVRGDVIIAIDSAPVAQILAANAARVSGSFQWRQWRSLQQLGQGPRGSQMHVTLRRGAIELSIVLSRMERATVEPPVHASIERFDDGIYYIGLSRVSIADIDAHIDRLAAAPGVVFDVRDRPNGNHQVLSHLLAVADTSTWMAIPHIVRPDSPSRPSSWVKEGWNLPAQQPHIGGRVAFLTGPGAISYSESVMGLVEYYHLGEIVGAATAGTNGDVADIALPSGCTSRFTARRVTKPDSSRHYLLGIQPTIPASRTMGGVLAGRDEVLEKALIHIRAVK